jgi:hypothetical protein
MPEEFGYMNAETRRASRRVSRWDALNVERATRFVSEAGAQRLRATICLEDTDKGSSVTISVRTIHAPFAFPMPKINPVYGQWRTGLD